MPTSDHPALSPRAYATSQRIAVIAAALLILSAPLQVILAFAIPNAILFVITALLSLMLVLPLILTLSATPPITLTDEGFTVHPAIGRASTVRWEDVTSLKPYPLLPGPDSEVLRRSTVGRKNYKAAEGLMLTCPTLPWRYRVVGFFTGEGLTPTVAVTNRSHANYAHIAHVLGKRFQPM
jgi:hypothetical protein